MIAALYVQTGGVYYGLDDVDPWDEQRDARLYAGPWPVVAHPPCGRWCRLAKFVEAVYGYKVGDDGGTFAAALDAVHTYGGVIEHPAGSLAWDHFGLPKPQVRYGWTMDIARRTPVQIMARSVAKRDARVHTAACERKSPGAV